MTCLLQARQVARAESRVQLTLQHSLLVDVAVPFRNIALQHQHLPVRLSLRFLKLAECTQAYI
jgi:hypothetical protein